MSVLCDLVLGELGAYYSRVVEYADSLRDVIMVVDKRGNRVSCVYVPSGLVDELRFTLDEIGNWEAYGREAVG